MEKSNLGSNFTPEVALWPFLRMHTKSGKMVQNLPRTQGGYSLSSVACTTRLMSYDILPTGDTTHLR